MKKTILEVYALIVCFVSLAVFVTYLGTGAYNVVRIVAPSVTLPAAEQRQYLNNEQYCEGNEACYTSGDQDHPQLLPDDQITKMRESNHAAALKSEQMDATNFLVWVAIFIPVSLGVFAAHWQIARRSREAKR
jgi:hypothetical protein